MRKQVLGYILLIVAVYPITFVANLFFYPAPIANILGLFALLSYIASLVPSLIKAVFPSTKKNKIIARLLKYRRHIGVAAFSLGLNHGVLLILKLQLNLLVFHTYINYIQGFSTLLIFTLLAFTSHDEAVKNLKAKWRKLHQLTYLAIFIMPWHILDKMSGHWTYITPVAASLSLGIVGLFITRQYKLRLKMTQSSSK